MLPIEHTSTVSLMQRKWLMGLLACVLVAFAFLGVGASGGVAQTSGCLDPLYCPQEPTTGKGGDSGVLTKSQLRRRCIAKAQTKFGLNRPKLKKAIKKCKKKYR
jgi:hypothetical protein